MASQPGSNQVSLIAVDEGIGAVGLIWDPNTNSLGNEKKLNNRALPTYTKEQIAAVYVETSTNRSKAIFFQSIKHKISYCRSIQQISRSLRLHLKARHL